MKTCLRSSEWRNLVERVKEERAEGEKEEEEEVEEEEEEEEEVEGFVLLNDVRPPIKNF